MQPDDKLCYCFHVSQRKVMNFIRIHRPRVPSEISECGGAGTGCGWCVPFLKRLFESHRTKQGGMIEMDSS
ncbi:MAG: bacterioferritin-associated ferredoxin, partial [Phycisphaerae bacterium]